MALVGAAAIGTSDAQVEQALGLGVTEGAIDHAAEAQAHFGRARTLAAEKKLVDAEAAFEDGIRVANAEGMRLLELLGLRDLKKYVLDSEGRGAEAEARLADVEDPMFALDGILMGAPIAELDKLTELDAEEVIRGDKARRLAEEARLAREEAERRAREMAAKYEGSNELLARINAKLGNTDREYGLYGPDKAEDRPGSQGDSRPNSGGGSSDRCQPPS